MTFKVAFIDSTWREISADCFTIEEDWIVFTEDDRPVLTVVRDNMLFIEPVEAPAEPAFKLK